MNRQTFALLQGYMESCMQESCHDREHVLRVLHNALRIAEGVGHVDYDVLIAACLLHDIARPEQMADPTVCHALLGGDKAHAFLTANGFPADFADRVRSCIRTHRFRKAMPPESIEAKILFDADKLDAVGAIGMARALMYNGAAGEPVYSRREDGSISDGEGDAADSFCHEYRFKLCKLYGSFLTERGARLAREREDAAIAFYTSLMQEVQGTEEVGKAILENILA